MAFYEYLCTEFVLLLPMKKFLLFLLVTTLFATLNAQEQVPAEEVWKAEEIEGSYYHGYSFHKNWEVDFTVESQDGRYTPSNEDIAKAERLIKKRIAYVNRNHENQEGKCPVIDEHMNKYERQYVGFTDIYGYRIVWVNFIWDESGKLNLFDDVILTKGGCAHFWHIKVNIDTEKIYGLEVNGDEEFQVIPRVKKKGPRISRPKNANKPQRIRKTGIIHSPEEKVF